MQAVNPPGLIDLSKTQIAVAMGLFQIAAAHELEKVSHVEYDSHDICEHYMGKVMERLSAVLPNLPNLGAAAPAMAEAIELALNCKGMIPTTSAAEGGASSYSEAVHIADKLRAALAKAKGESHG